MGCAFLFSLQIKQSMHRQEASSLPLTLWPQPCLNYVKRQMTINHAVPQSPSSLASQITLSLSAGLQQDITTVTSTSSDLTSLTRSVLRPALNALKSRFMFRSLRSSQKWHMILPLTVAEVNINRLFANHSCRLLFFCFIFQNFSKWH